MAAKGGTMRLFGKCALTGPDAVFPLPPTQPRQSVQLPLDRFIEQVHYAIGETSVLIQDYTRRSNYLNELIQHRKPPARELQDEANSAFAWLSERIKYWTETFEWQFRSFSPPTDELARVQDALARWMVGWRDGAYYALAAKMYYARLDNQNGTIYELRSGECTQTQAAAIEDFFGELESAEVKESELIDLLKLPEWLVTGMVAELCVSMRPTEIYNSFPALLEHYPEVEAALAAAT